jgi:tetratricopeptide (TPR) repeat protein
VDEAVFKKHQQAHTQWNTICASIDSLRAERKYPDIVSAVTSGLESMKAYEESVAPPFCVLSLQQELAQARYNLHDYSEAEKVNLDVVVKLKPLDTSRWAIAKEFQGFILLAGGKHKEAEALFKELLEWQGGDAKRSLPMVQVTAHDMRRTTLLGLGIALSRQGHPEKALTQILEALPLLSDAQDVENVRVALEESAKCFVALKNIPQAIDTVERLISWCTRNEAIASHAEEATKWLEQLKGK